MLNKLLICAALLSAPAFAHEMTPAYPEAKVAPLAGLVKFEMSLFNARADIGFYEVGLFDIDGNPLPFSTSRKVIKVDYKERKNFDVYVRRADWDRAVYLCTISKIRKASGSNALLSSRICSRVDGAFP